MMKSTAASSPTAQIAYRGAAEEIVGEIMRDAIQYNFGAFAMKTRLVDEFQKGSVADDKLRAIRAVEVKQFATRLDVSMFPFALQDVETLGAEQQQATEYRSSVSTSDSTNQALSS